MLLAQRCAARRRMRSSSGSDDVVVVVVVDDAELLLLADATRLSSALYLQLSDVDVGARALMPRPSSGRM